MKQKELEFVFCYLRKEKSERNKTRRRVSFECPLKEIKEQAKLLDKENFAKREGKGVIAKCLKLERIFGGQPRI